MSPVSAASGFVTESASVKSTDSEKCEPASVANDYQPDQNGWTSSTGSFKTGTGSRRKLYLPADSATARVPAPGNRSQADQYTCDRSRHLSNVLIAQASAVKETRSAGTTRSAPPSLTLGSLFVSIMFNPFRSTTKYSL